MTFNELGLIKPLIDSLEDAGHVIPTPIQEKAIPQILIGKKRTWMCSNRNW